MPQAPAKKQPAATTPAPAANGEKKGKKKSAAPAAPPKVDPPKQQQPTPAQPGQQREVLYHKVEVEICSGAEAITADMAKAILNWETEKDYQTRSMLENPGTKPEVWTYGDVFFIKDEEGNKVRCWDNLDNRPFDDLWCRGLAQTILNGQWAGEITIPGETVNGSTVVISRTGKVESGQHSLTAEIIADQLFRKNPQKYPFWEGRVNAVGEQTGPVIETILIKGVSEDPRVLMTVDNCKPRSEADVFYTSELFRTLMPVDRKECSRMLATAVDLLWKRTNTQGYKTHAEVVAFVDRHKKILKCIEHLFVENSAKGGRKISNLRISAGQASALCYLMGCSDPKTDGDVYRNGFPPSEKGLNWDRMDRAKQFWAMIGASKQFALVREALGRLVDSSVDSDTNTGQGGRLPEKLAIIAKAWEIWVAQDGIADEVFREDDLTDGGRLNLTYINWRFDPKQQTNVNLPDGQLDLQDVADFAGIDIPPDMTAATVDPPQPAFTAEQMEAAKEQARQDRTKADRAKQAAEDLKKRAAGVK